MPAPEVDANDLAARPVVGHVSVPVTLCYALCYTANSCFQKLTRGVISPCSLRTIVRSMLATGPPSVSSSFVSAARVCLKQSAQRSMGKQPVLFEAREWHGRIEFTPSSRLYGLLSHIRTLYGAGLGFDSLDALVGIVRATTALRWDEDDNLVNELAVIDADISQAIQSCREEYAGGNVRDISTARAVLRRLRAALNDCRTEVESWGGEFPFSRGSANAECLQI